MLYLLKKIVGSLIVVFSILALMFVLSKQVPGDPARLVLGQHINKGSYDVLRQEMELDKPIAMQAEAYLKGLISGNWGRSFVSHREVKDIIIDALPITLKLCFAAIFFALFSGISMGALAAYKENSIADRIISVLSVAGFSMPHFWAAVLLQVMFGIVFKVLPVSGIGDGQLYYYILPGLAIGLPLGMTYVRLTRAFLLEIIDKPFIIAARGWGLPRRKVFRYHVVPNFLYLLTTQLTTDIALLLGGAVVAETIFSLPGVGSVLVSAVLHRDWPVIQGTVLVTAMLVAGLNLLAKLAGPMIDPRIQGRSVQGGTR